MRKRPVVPCPRCGAEDTISRGWTSAGTPLRYCHGCGRKFVTIGVRTLTRPPRGSTADESFDFYGTKEVQSPLPGSPCQVWQGPFNSEGYGVFKSAGKEIRAHVFAYVRAYGPLTEEGCDVDHVCHNKLCLNPLHLKPKDKAKHKRDHNLQETEITNRIFALVPEEKRNEIRGEVIAEDMRKHLSSLRPPAWWWHYAA